MIRWSNKYRINQSTEAHGRLGWIIFIFPSYYWKDLFFYGHLEVGGLDMYKQHLVACWFYLMFYIAL